MATATVRAAHISTDNLSFLRGQLNTAILNNDVKAVDAIIAKAKKAGVRKKLLNEPIDGTETALMMALDVRHDDAGPEARAKIIKTLMKNGANPNCEVKFTMRVASGTQSKTQKVALLMFALRYGDDLVRKALVQSKQFDPRPKKHGYETWEQFIQVCEALGIRRTVVAATLLSIREYHTPERHARKASVLEGRLKASVPPGRTPHIPRSTLSALARKLGRHDRGR